MITSAEWGALGQRLGAGGFHRRQSIDEHGGQEANPVCAWISAAPRGELRRRRHAPGEGRPQRGMKGALVGLDVS
jgi:hypothetical protein